MIIAAGFLEDLLDVNDSTAFDFSRCAGVHDLELFKDSTWLHQFAFRA